MLKGELFTLSMFSLLGILVMLAAQQLPGRLPRPRADVAVSLYALVAMRRDDAGATEAAMKYFVLGALASGFLLYGLSMMYGATGSLEISEVYKAIGTGQINAPVLILGTVFIVAGLAFKLGAVPFHMWVPDVYQGAPTAVTLLVGGAPKLAAFAITIRLLVEGMIGLAVDWQQMLVVLSVGSMLLGNLAAIAQTNLKRMLAYSTIAQIGFMLLGLCPGVVNGNTLSASNAYSSAMFYVVTDVLTTLGTFGMIMLLSRAGHEAELIDDFKRPGRAQPVVRRRHGGLHVLARRHAADGRLLRQARGAAVAGLDQRHRADLAGRGRGGAVAARRVLLPARRQGDVLRRAGRHPRRSQAPATCAPAVAQRRRRAAARHPAGRPDGALRAGDRQDARHLKARAVSPPPQRSGWCCCWRWSPPTCRS